MTVLQLKWHPFQLTASFSWVRTRSSFNRAQVSFSFFYINIIWSCFGLFVGTGHMFTSIKGLLMIWLHQEKEWKQTSNTCRGNGIKTNKVANGGRSHTATTSNTRTQVVLVGGGDVSPHERNTKNKKEKNDKECLLVAVLLGFNRTDPHTDLTSSTATSWPLRSSLKAKGCLWSRPGLTSHPRRGREAMWLFRSSRSLWRSSWLSLRRHQRSRQRLLDRTFR